MALTFKIVSVASQKVLGVSPDRMKVRQFLDTGGTNQKWRFIPVERGYFKIVSQENWKVLEVPNADPADGVEIQQSQYINMQHRHWGLEPVGEDSFKIVSRATGSVLQAYSTEQIQQFRYKGETNQKWRLVVVADNGTIFKIVSRASWKVLEVPRDNIGDGVPIRQFRDTGEIHQKWQLVPVPKPKNNSLFKIVSLLSGKVIDVPEFKRDDKIPIQQYQDNGGQNQQWKLISVGFDSLMRDGFFKIISQASGKVLEVPNANPADEIPIQQNRDIDGVHQHWRLVPVDYDQY